MIAEINTENILIVFGTDKTREGISLKNFKIFI